MSLAPEGREGVAGREKPEDLPGSIYSACGIMGATLLFLGKQLPYPRTMFIKAMFKKKDMKKTFKIFSAAVAASILLASCTKDSEKTVTVDFEDAAFAALIDSPQYGGSLLYGEMNPETYAYNVNYTWVDAQSQLGFDGFPSSWGSVCFSSGGEVISNYVVADYAGAGYLRQLEVPAAPASGKNFAVHYGYADPTAEGAAFPALIFKDKHAHMVMSFDVCPTSYLLNSAVNGDGFFGPLGSSSKISVKVYGLDMNGKATGTPFEFDLLFGSEVESIKSGAKSIAWETVPLYVLGNVYGLAFQVCGTSDCYGDYGFNAPAYFAYDNIVIKVDEE